MRSSLSKRPIALVLLAAVAQAHIDWNLESTFLMHLQQQADEYEHTEGEPGKQVHIYPTWVSEGTCSTKCVDIRGEEEFCVATSTCEHATWRRAFDRHKTKDETLNSFEVPMSMSHCEVWGDLNRCDGTLCEEDHACQSGCCGSYVSFTHKRCLPLVGDYCAGKDTTRKHFYHAHENSLDLEHLEPELVHGDEHLQKEALKKHAQERLHDAESYGDLSDVVEELVQLQSLYEVESNEVPVNGDDNEYLVEEPHSIKPCKDHGHKDLCDEMICEFDGHCRSGCCSEVLTKHYKRCTAMLVGDYCPRALDPIHEMLEAEMELAIAEQALDVMTEAAIKTGGLDHQPVAVPVGEATELPCNVFGTVDRCDGMACEHDGNCFSGCCSLFVSGDQKRCMPLVGGDLCPIAIDVVEKFQIVSDDHPAVVGEDVHGMGIVPDVEMEHPIMEKGEHHDVAGDDYEDAEHVIPVKGEHHETFEQFQDLEEEYDDAEHFIPEKGEHHDLETSEHGLFEMPEDNWRPTFHSQGDLDEDPRHHYEHYEGEDWEDGHEFLHHYEHEDGIDDRLLDDENDSTPKGMLQPKKPKEDDPRLQIPKGKAKAMHDHVIVPKDPSEEEPATPLYGQAYEHERKRALHGTGESAKLTPIQPIGERKVPIMSPEMVARQQSRKPCNTYGTTNRCEGMSCSEDSDCASQCCGQLTGDGSLQCHALIEGSFCPRALAPLIDYSTYTDDDSSRRNDILRTQPSNELPVYRGKDGCKVHGTEDQCDGQACNDDSDCHSGCCGHFVSFSLRRCLPLTEDSLCPRFLEPSYTSPIPARLPPIESTIKDMYLIQDRVHRLQEVLDPDSLPIHQDVLFCRSHGSSKLCDGFVCSSGRDCQSGCCGTFGTLKQDFCQPLIEDVCPVAGFIYGPHGNIYDEHDEALTEVPTPGAEMDSIPSPPQFAADGTGEKPPTEQKKENAFWNGVAMGVAIWVGIVIALIAVYFLCCKKTPSSAEQQQQNAVNEASRYQDLPASQQEA